MRPLMPDQRVPDTCTTRSGKASKDGRLSDCRAGLFFDCHFQFPLKMIRTFEFADCRALDCARIGGEPPASIDVHSYDELTQYFGTFPIPNNLACQYSLFHRFDLNGDDHTSCFVACGLNDEAQFRRSRGTLRSPSRSSAPQNQSSPPWPKSMSAKPSFRIVSAVNRTRLPAPTPARRRATRWL